MFLLGTLAAENFYWMNGSGNWSDPEHWSTDRNEFKPNGEVPGENDDVFILDNCTDLTIQLNENTTIYNLHWEAGKIDGFEGAKLTVSGELKTSEAVTNDMIDKTIIKGSGNLNNLNLTEDVNIDEENISAQAPKYKSQDEKFGYEVKAAPTFTAVDVTNASCNGLGDGIIQITVDDADEY
ncbi:MAG: hypothetical protein C0599_02065 [Salinivirgaceae bacterium]|nr:MAG: hypothetical protein C0599_02065 [Salinivirgaceae bacterium]